MRRSILPGILLILLLGAAPVRAGDGQGEADPDARIAGLDLGTYWYGAPIDKKALQGKVVLVEIWGS